MIPIDFLLVLLVEGFYSTTRYHSGSFSLVNVGSGFLLPVYFVNAPPVAHCCDLTR